MNGWRGGIQDRKWHRQVSDMNEICIKWIPPQFCNGGALLTSNLSSRTYIQVAASMRSYVC